MNEVRMFQVPVEEIDLGKRALRDSISMQLLYAYAKTKGFISVTQIWVDGKWIVMLDGLDQNQISNWRGQPNVGQGATIGEAVQDLCEKHGVSLGVLCDPAKQPVPFETLKDLYYAGAEHAQDEKREMKIEGCDCAECRTKRIMEELRHGRPQPTV